MKNQLPNIKSHARYILVKAPLAIASTAALLAYAGGALRDNIVQPNVDALYYNARSASAYVFGFEDAPQKTFEVTQAQLDKLPKQNACVVALKAASKLEGVPLTIMAAILMTENARLDPNATLKNDNGTTDGGCNQVNSIHWEKFFAKTDDVFDPFLNAIASAKILKEKKEECGGDWQKAQLCYHSKTEKHAANYQVKINTNIQKYVPEAPLNKVDTKKLAAKPVKAKQHKTLVADASYSNKERQGMDGAIEKYGR